GMEHRAAAPRREAVAGEVDDVDVRRARRDAFVEDARAFVDERVDQALDDLLVADLPPRHAAVARMLLDHRVDFGRRMRGAVAGPVVAPAGAGLLAEAPALAEQVGHARVRELRTLLRTALADRPADV